MSGIPSEPVELASLLARLEGLAVQLHTTGEHLDEQIDKRAAKLAEPQIEAAQAEAAEAEQELERNYAFHEQRIQDLRKEFERQRKPLERQRDRAIAAKEKAEERVRELEDLLGSVSLYIQWFYVTRQLTTEQKEMFADAVEAWSRRLNDEAEEPKHLPRWWRDDYTGPFPDGWRR